VHPVDLVRFGALAAGIPAVGDLYAQVVHDYFVGTPSRKAEDYSLLTGLSTKQVGRSFDTLQEWGLVSRRGSNRSRKLVLEEAPNLEFARAVVMGLYGPEQVSALEADGADFPYTPVHGDHAPLAAFALAVLLRRYGDRGFYHWSPPEPTEKSGSGYVVLSEVGDWRHLLYCYSISSSLIYTTFVTIYKRYTVEQMSPKFSPFFEDLLTPPLTVYRRAHVSKRESRLETLETFELFLPETPVANAETPSGTPLNPSISIYSDDLPCGLGIPEQTTPTRGRAAKARRFETLPATSGGFVYWPNDKLPLDPNYAAAVDVLTYWNEQVGTGERMNWKLYIPVRECLVEQALSPADLQRAIRAVKVHTYWAGKMTLYKLCSNPHIIRELLGVRNGHDRFARSMPAIPRKDAVAVEF